MAGHSIKSPDGTLIFLDYCDSFGSAIVNGREWKWEFSIHGGPLWMKSDGVTPRKCQHPTVKGVWDAFDKWFNEFHKIA